MRTHGITIGPMTPVLHRRRGATRCASSRRTASLLLTLATTQGSPRIAVRRVQYHDDRSGRTALSTGANSQ